VVPGTEAAGAHRPQSKSRIISSDDHRSLLGIAWLTSLSGLSLALGAFIAGLVISESEYSHQAMAEVLPFRDSFNSLFFVSIGILMDCGCWSSIPSCGQPPACNPAGEVRHRGRRSLHGEGCAAFRLHDGDCPGASRRIQFLAGAAGQESGLLRAIRIRSFWRCRSVDDHHPFLIQWSPDMARRIEAIQRLRHWLPSRTTAHMLQSEGKQVRIKDHVIIVGYGLNGRNLAAS